MAAAMAPHHAHSQENIKACVRVRPLNKRERQANDVTAWDINSVTHTLIRKQPPSKSQVGASREAAQLNFPCSTLFDHHSTTAELYDGQVRDIVESAMRGVNGSVLVYGQTSSGKVRWHATPQHATKQHSSWFALDTPNLPLLLIQRSGSVLLC
jgi:hypothetical protein